jgi:hypothetical protein
MRSREGSADGSREEVYRSPSGIAHWLGGDDDPPLNSQNRLVERRTARYSATQPGALRNPRPFPLKTVTLQISKTPVGELSLEV